MKSDIAGFRAQQRRNALEFVQALPQDDRERLLAALVPIIDRCAPSPQSALAVPPASPSVAPVGCPQSPIHPARAQEQLV